MNPLRLEIYLVACGRESVSPTDLADELDQPLGNVSYHVTQLAEKGLLELVGTEPIRGAVKHFYKPAPIPARYRSAP